MSSSYSHLDLNVSSSRRWVIWLGSFHLRLLAHHHKDPDNRASFPPDSSIVISISDFAGAQGRTWRVGTAYRCEIVQIRGRALHSQWISEQGAMPVLAGRCEAVAFHTFTAKISLGVRPQLTHIQHPHHRPLSLITTAPFRPHLRHIMANVNWRTINIDALDPDSPANFDLKTLTPAVAPVSTADVQNLASQIRQLLRGGDSEGALRGALETAPYGADEQGKVGDCHSLTWAP